METIRLAAQTRHRAPLMGSGSFPKEPVFHRTTSLQRPRPTPLCQVGRPSFVATQRLGERRFHLADGHGLGTPFYLRVYDSLSLGTVVVMTEMDEETGWRLTYGAATTIRAIAEQYHLDLDATVWLDQSVAKATFPQVGVEQFFIQIIVKPDEQLYWQYLPTERVTLALGEGVLNVHAFM